LQDKGSISEASKKRAKHMSNSLKENSASSSFIGHVTPFGKNKSKNSRII
jgi:hypothetical protein